jgi:hypothetical protein
MAFTPIGGTLGGTILTLLFLPSLYALWYRIKPSDVTREGPNARLTIKESNAQLVASG